MATKPSLKFTITMDNGATVGHDECHKVELDMAAGQITAIHIWPIEGQPYSMRIPDQDHMACIASEVNKPEPPPAAAHAEPTGDPR